MPENARKSRPACAGKLTAGDQFFKSDEAMLLAAARVFKARSAVSDDERSTPKDRKAQQTQADLQARDWHQAAAQTESNSRLCRLMQEECLSRIERELVVLLVLHELAIIKSRLREFSDLTKLLCLSDREIIRLARSLKHGRLGRSSLLMHDEWSIDGAIPEVSPLATEAALAHRRDRAATRRIQSEEELTLHLGQLAQACREKANVFADIERGLDWHAKRLPALERRIARELLQIETAVQRHPDWYLAPVFTELADDAERLIVLLLSAREHDLEESDQDLFTGTGLARALSKAPGDVGLNLRMVSTRSRLIKGGWVQPCGGMPTPVGGRPVSVGKMEFELTDAALGRLNLERRSTGETGLGQLLEPRLSLSRLVLPPAARAGLELGLAQVRNSKVLMQDWGLAEHIPYGTGVTMLFYGLPGTGKTAGAEAVAHELGKRVLVVDYSKVRNLYVGNTEKNVARAFELARRHDAVLFWDEADAMLFDRGMAARSWEVSQVNVLLQELERFPGVCILASNRQAAMDKALERRISLRIEFPFPDRETRRKLWEILIPPKMPLAPDVQLDLLADYELSGGQIKNVIVNAGRMACTRGGAQAVSNSNFKQAVQLEYCSIFCITNRKKIGFMGD